MDGFVKLGLVVGAVGLVAAVEAYHAGDDAKDDNEAILARYVSERTAELIAEGHDAAAAHRIAEAEAEEALRT